MYVARLAILAGWHLQQAEWNQVTGTLETSTD